MNRKIRFTVVKTLNWSEVGKSLSYGEFSIPGINDIDISSLVIKEILKAAENGETCYKIKKSLEKVISNHEEWQKLNSVFPDKQNYYTDTSSLLERIYGLYVSMYYLYNRYLKQLRTNKRNLWMFTSVIDPSCTNLERSLHDKVYEMNSSFWERFYPPNSPFDRARIRRISDKEFRRLDLGLDEPKIITKRILISGNQYSVSGIETEDENFSTYPGWDFNFYKEWSEIL